MPASSSRPPSPSLDDQKKILRKEYRAKRALVCSEDRLAAANALVQHPLNFLTVKEAQIVGGYYPSKDEIDVLPLLRVLEAMGHQLCLPVIDAQAQPLLFRRWDTDTELICGDFDIPIPGEAADYLQPDIFLVPLLAFDKQGYRLGYGGGFYDRTLSRARARHPSNREAVVAIGVAFDTQEAAKVPIDEFDQQLDWILTPSGPRKIAT